MVNLCVKLKQKENNKYRYVLSTEDEIYPSFNVNSVNAILYSPDTLLDDGEWFYVEDVTKQIFKIDLLDFQFSTVDFDSLNSEAFEKIDYVFVVDKDLIYFQNVTKTKLVAKNGFLSIGGDFKYEKNIHHISFNVFPDAVYDRKKDTLYFRRLASITSIFHNIDQLYREATEEETRQFLSEKFISLKEGYDSSYVKTSNRKRIALAQTILSQLDESSRHQIFEYIGVYYPVLRGSNGSFHIGSENDLKLLLYGIEQRFYTTVVGGEKRIANSVIKI